MEVVEPTITVRVKGVVSASSPNANRRPDGSDEISTSTVFG